MRNFGDWPFTMAGNMALDCGVSDAYWELARAFRRAKWRVGEHGPDDPLWTEVKVVELKYIETLAKFIEPHKPISAYVISSLTRQLEEKGLYWGHPGNYPSFLLEAVALPPYKNPLLVMGTCPDGLYLLNDSVECNHPRDMMQKELTTVAYWRLFVQQHVDRADELPWSGTDKPTVNTLHLASEAQSRTNEFPHTEPTGQWSGHGSTVRERRCHGNRRRPRSRRRYAAREIYDKEMRQISQPGNGLALVLLAIKYQRLTVKPLGLCVRRLRSQLVCQASTRPWEFVKKLGRNQCSLKHRLVKQQ